MKLIDEITSAHGDPDIWNKYNRIITTLSFGGLAFWMKFNIRGYIKRRYIISLNNPMVIIENFPGSGFQGIFTPDEVWIETYSGKRIRERQDPRAIIQQWPHTFVWDYLDLLYFAGYSIWNYFNAPYIFCNNNFKFTLLLNVEMNSVHSKKIEVLFPDEIPSHCKRQIFYFDNNNRITRFDYDPEVFSPRAKASQYCYDYQNFNGIWFPAERKVFPRSINGNSFVKPVLVWIRVNELHLQ